ncbi:phage holin, lambda family [Halomonas sp. SL1]|uniref:phage holin, lambda family n=1 Tax=Halomonas sp. SL1 TaxID=2137478 RepID=UPI0015ECAE43|nr:phage holin, lambda family [Halomonas sp. SL1]
MTQTSDAMSSPDKDPNVWQAALDAVAAVWPQLYAAGLAFTLALVRALHAGGKPVKSILEAVMCGCMTLAMMPVLNHFGLSQNLAVAIGAALAFLGVEWFRDRAGAAAERLIKRWTR